MSRHWKSIILLILSPFLYLNPIQSIFPFSIYIPVLCLVYFTYTQTKFKYLVPIYLGLILDLFVSPVFGVYMLLYFLIFLSLEKFNPFKSSPSALSISVMCMLTQFVLIILERIVWAFLGISTFGFSLGSWLGSALGTAIIALIIFTIMPMPLNYLRKTERNPND